MIEPLKVKCYHCSLEIDYREALEPHEGHQCICPACECPLGRIQDNHNCVHSLLMKIGDLKQSNLELTCSKN